VRQVVVIPVVEQFLGVVAGVGWQTNGPNSVVFGRPSEWRRSVDWQHGLGADGQDA
jgi:hypothetical protein